MVGFAAYAVTPGGSQSRASSISLQARACDNNLYSTLLVNECTIHDSYAVTVSCGNQQRRRESVLSASNLTSVRGRVNDKNNQTENSLSMGLILRLLLLLYCASHGSSLRTNQTYLRQRPVRKPYPAATLEFIKRRSPPNVPPFSTPSRADRSCPVTDMDHRGWSIARESTGRTRERVLQSLSTHSS